VKGDVAIGVLEPGGQAKGVVASVLLCAAIGQGGFDQIARGVIGVFRLVTQGMNAERFFQRMGAVGVLVTCS